MEMSVREAKARFSEAINNAARGERVIVTKDGEPFVEIIKVRKPETEDFFTRLNRVRKEMGLDGVTVQIDDGFDDPAFSRRVLGLE